MKKTNGSLRICRDEQVGVKLVTTGIVFGHPFDICECGDYRSEHQEGAGACTLNGLGHLGAPKCDAFRLDKKFIEGVVLR